MIIVILVVGFVVIFGYPYFAHKFLKLREYGFGVVGIGAQHWVLNAMLFLAPHSMCTSYYEPTREVFIASQLAFWIPVLIMRYWRKVFTRIDRIWVRGGYPFVFLGLYSSIYIYIDVVRGSLVA